MATQQMTQHSKLASTTVGEAMSPGVVTCEHDALLPAVAASLAAHSFHTVIVAPRTGSTWLAVSDLELIRAALDKGLAQSVGEIAREPIAVIEPSASLERAVAVMARSDITHVLVADADADWPTGVLSSFDIAAVLAGRDPRLARTIRPAPARPLVSATTLSATTVGDVMHPGVIARPPETLLHELAGTMSDLRVHCVAVAGVGRRGDGDEHLVWGIVSDSDVVHAAHRGEHTVPAGELAATVPIALSEAAPLDRAARLMVDHEVTHLVAVGQSGLPTGVVSSLDVIRILAAG